MCSNVYKNRKKIWIKQSSRSLRYVYRVSIHIHVSVQVRKSWKWPRPDPPVVTARNYQTMVLAADQVSLKSIKDRLYTQQPFLVVTFFNYTLTRASAGKFWYHICAISFISWSDSFITVCMYFLYDVLCITGIHGRFWLTTSRHWLLPGIWSRLSLNVHIVAGVSTAGLVQDKVSLFVATDGAKIRWYNFNHFHCTEWAHI